MNELENDEQLSLRSPWVLYDMRLCKLFGRDLGVEVEIDEKAKKYTIRVQTAKKADALSRIMPGSVDFGLVTFRICITPANAGEVLPEDAPMIDVIKAAFDGNGSISEIRPVSKGLFKDLTYCVFEKRVIQYEADNLSDINGFESTLMECIAREVLTGANGVFFCTGCSVGECENGAESNKPLGEWP